jgi:dTDP-4-amino-4,6-dideoxygalactose transaminase
MCYLRGDLIDAVNEETLAVVHVHPFGIALPIEEVIAAARGVGAVVIEDAAQALGAKWEGRPVGTMGDFGLFSLGPGKPVSTGGGGIAIANSAEGIEAINRWWSDLPPNRGSVTAWLRQAAFQLAFQPQVWWAMTRVGLQKAGNHEKSWGYSVRGLTQTQAAIGLSLLPRLDWINGQRRAKASLLEDVIGRSNSLRGLIVQEQSESFYLRFPLLTESNAQREVLFDRLWSAGIGVGRLYERTLPSIFFAEERTGFPGAEAVARQLITLPTHHYVSAGDMALMTAILEEFR